MRIAYVLADRGIPAFGSKGASIHIQQMMGALAGLDHRVTLLAAVSGQTTGSVAAADIVEIRAAGNMGCEKDPAATDASSEITEKRRHRERLAIATGEAAEETLRRLHAACPFNLIYERYSLFSAAGVRAAKTLGVPCLLEVNAPLVQEQRRYRKLVQATVAEAIEAEVFLSADYLLAVSEQVRAYAVSKGAAPERAVVVANGVDVTTFNPSVPATRTNALAGKFVIGFSGSLKPWHGIDVLMDAFRLLAQRSPHYHLLVIGDGPLRDWLEGYLRGAGLAHAATLTGWVDHEQLPGLLRAMDVAVAPYPSNEDFYFSPLKLYEYMAIGTPVVASRVGQIAEVIEHGKTGLLVEPGNPVALADAVERVRRDSRLATETGARAARKAATFTWRRNAQAVLALADRAKRALAAPVSA